MNKYHAKPTTIDNIRFDSAKEARRYAELCLLQRAGEISHLQLQVKYDLVVNGIKVCRYIADFRYISADGQTHVEDTKGYATPQYRLKAKLLKAIYGIVIEEV